MVSAISLDGDSLARNIRARLSVRVLALREAGIDPHFVSILVGDDSASVNYVARKHSDCRETGITSTQVRLRADISPARLERHIADANDDRGVHGLLVQLPLPQHLDDRRILSRISPTKDVDGLHPQNLGHLLSGKPYVLPCTPAGILALLRHHEVPLAGRKAVVVGRGALVGRPLSMLLSMSGIDATVTLAHTRTPDLAHLTAQADIIVAAAGVPDLIHADMVKRGAAVVGVGITLDANGNVISDISDDVQGIAGWVTPRHGSVGALTRAMLLSNLLTLAEARTVDG